MKMSREKLSFENPGIITVSSDFGQQEDNERAAGAAATVNPRLAVRSFTHSIKPYSILDGAWKVLEAYRSWPAAAVHVAIVDPGVGTSRKGLIIEGENGQTFVGPDNGILLPAAREAGIRNLLVIDRERVEAGERSTFDGRDLFLPVAARIASGVKPQELGNEISESEITKFAFQANQVVHIDGYGNVKVENECKGFISGRSELFVGVPWGEVVVPYHRTFGDVAKGKLLAYSGSSRGRLEFAVNQGARDSRSSAADVLGVKAGDVITIYSFLRY
jgi:S-adenosylmethionine hydrolase